MDYSSLFRPAMLILHTCFLFHSPAHASEGHSDSARDRAARCIGQCLLCGTMNWHHSSLPKSSLPKPPLQEPSPSPWSFEEQKSSKLCPLSHSMPEYPYGLPFPYVHSLHQGPMMEWNVHICWTPSQTKERGFML